MRAAGREAAPTSRPRPATRAPLSPTRDVVVIALRWGRNVESFGEDPSLVATLGAAYIDGIQRGLPANASVAASYIKISAVPKHLGAYSLECFNASGGANEYPACPVCAWRGEGMGQ